MDQKQNDQRVTFGAKMTKVTARLYMSLSVGLLISGLTVSAADAVAPQVAKADTPENKPAYVAPARPASGTVAATTTPAVTEPAPTSAPTAAPAATVPAPATTPTAAPAPAAPEKKPLDKATLALVKQLQAAQKDVYNSRSPQGAATYFKGQWLILQMVAELSERTPEVRAQIAETDKEVAAFLKQNDTTMKGLHGLMLDFQQQLGLSNVTIAIPRRMTDTNPIPTKVVSTDISLTGEEGEKPPQDVSRTLEQRDRQMIADFENYMKRLSYHSNKNDYVRSERDWQGAADNFQGAYFFMLLVQQDPRYAIAYPETYKYLKTLKSGKVAFPKEAPAKAAKPAKPAAVAEGAPADAFKGKSPEAAKK